MANNLNINNKTAWADLVEEEEKARASAGAGTPQKEEKGWTNVKAPKKSKPPTKDSAPAGSVARKLDFSNGKTPYANPDNKFAALAESDSE